jgi:hypothetical protein
MVTFRRVLAVTVLTVMLPTCHSAPQERRKVEVGTPPETSARADEGVQWLVGDRFGMGIASSKSSQVVRLWEIRPAVRLLDTLVVPRLDSSEVLVGFYCRRRRSQDSRIVAVAVYADAPLYTTIHSAWQADTVAGRLVATTVAGIDCQNEGGGS